MDRKFWLSFCMLMLALACATPEPEDPADLIVQSGRIYSFGWAEPAPDGAPASGAPYSDSGWSPDAEAVAVKDGAILFVGSNAEVERYKGSATHVMDVAGATVLPGLIDSHTHIVGLGQLEVQVNLIGVGTEEEAVQRVVDASGDVAEGEWILARGWDEGAFPNNPGDGRQRYPTWDFLSETFPNNPVVMDSLHGFAVWANEKAFEAAGITRDTAGERF